MEYDGEARDALLNLFENVETQWGRNEDAVLVAGALLGFELVSTVRSTNRDCERINAGLLYEVDNIVGVGVGVVLSNNIVLDTCQYAKLTLNGYIELVCVVNNLFGESNILLVGEVATVNHNAREAHIDTRFAQLEAVAVVEVESDRNVFTELFCVLNSTLSHIAEEGLVSVLTSASRNLEDYGRGGLNASRDDCLQLLHVVEVVCRNCITAFDCFGEHLTSVYQA